MQGQYLRMLVRYCQDIKCQDIKINKIKRPFKNITIPSPPPNNKACIQKFSLVELFPIV